MVAESAAGRRRLVTVDEHLLDEAHIELAARRADALDFCDALERPLRLLYPATAELSQRAEQLCAQALHVVQRYREQQS